MSVPKMHSGGLGQYNRTLQAPLYEKISDILGSTGTIIPIFDQIDSSPFQPSSTVPDLAPTFSEAVSAWDTPFNFNDPDSYQGIIPVFDFNGTDEFLAFADNSFWTRDDSGSAPFSIGMWLQFDSNPPAAETLLAKYDTGEAIQEWRTNIGTSGEPYLTLRDDSAGVEVTYAADAGLSTGNWHFVVFVYDGTGGASALSDSNSPIYVDGAVVAGTESNNGSYVAMENGTSGVSLGARGQGANYFDGKIVGGALGPFFTQIELSAAQVAQLYRLGRQALEL